VQVGDVIIECVINVSEGRDEVILGELAACAGSDLLDLHRDPDHHRSVFTLAGPAERVVEASRALAAGAIGRLDLGSHEGAHPRQGVVDVVPFVPFDPGRTPPQDLDAVVGLRNEFARWLGTTFAVPSFLYGPLPGGLNRTLPQVRRDAFDHIAADFGPGQPHPTAGATAVGARTALVAYNIWVSNVEVARQVAPHARRPAVRALGLAVGDRAQVSCNLVDPVNFGPAQAYDAVTALVEQAGGTVTGAELVGLLPEIVLKAIPAARWSQLSLSAEATVEARLSPSSR
jgi:glutamate formiminotransferase / 5-formyltetrahydrofolate cyclo-ligase